MSVISFSNFLPLARYDGVPWTSALIQEAAAAEGPWTTIDTIVLTPTDTDPSDPSPRNFTTDNATLTAGWYRVIFKDLAGDQQPTNPLYNVPEARPEYWPDLGTVGALLRARTVDVSGVEAGTFTAGTRPTATQAEEQIGIAARDLSTMIGDDIPDVLLPDARRLVALRAAMLIELSYFPEQVGSTRSAYEQYRTLWLDAIGVPDKPGWFIRRFQEEASDGPDTTGVGMPKYGFPDGVMVGWGTRW